MQNIKENVMEKIKNDEIKMKPKYYFFIGSLFSFIGLVASIVTSIFLISVLSFSLRSHGPMGEVRLSLMLESFPIWIPIIAMLGIIFGIYMLRQYEFSYKSNFWKIIIGFILAIIVSGILIDIAGFNNLWMKKGPMRKYMHHYMMENNIKIPDDAIGPGYGRGNGQFRIRESL